MSSHYWLCKCGTRLPRSRQKCMCGGRRPAKRVPKHARTLRDDSYEVYRELNGRIHGPAMPGEWQSDWCGCCGRPPKDTRHLDRDHGHDKTELSYGKPRGLACPGDWGCNKLMSRLTLEKAKAIVAYLERVDDYYREAA